MQRHNIIHWDTQHHPLGEVTLAASEKGVCFLGIGKTAPKYLATAVPAPLHRCEKNELNELFIRAFSIIDGQLPVFSMTLDMRGTPFQQRVWAALQRIPYGQTISYRELAEMVSQPSASRAVAGACRKNPVALIVPCHRVIGSNGSLTGYAYGMPLKKRLLEWESEHLRSCEKAAISA